MSCGLKPVETEVVRRVYELDSDAKLKIFNWNGEVIVTPWEEEEKMELMAIITTREGKNELRKVDVVVSGKDNSMITTRYKKEDARVSVSLTVKVPEAAYVGVVQTSNGKIEIEGTRGDVILRTSDGKISAKNIEGFVTASPGNGEIILEGVSGVKRIMTANGDIRADIRDLKEDEASVETSKGMIELSINPSLDADIVINNIQGRIKNDIISMEMEEKPDGVFLGRLGNGGKKIRIHTANGNIKLYELAP